MTIKKYARVLRNAALSFLIGWFLMMTCMVTWVWADDRYFTMEQIIVDAQVLPDASMQVTERLTIEFSGQWNGFFVKIPQDGSPVTDVQVRENGRPYEFNPGTEYGPPGTFLVKSEVDGMVVDWSINARDQVRTFELSYRVENAVQIHTDVAELYRKFINEDNGNEISYLQVNLTLPPGAEQFKQGEDIRIWGHGPLTGVIEFAGPDKVVLEVSDLPAYTFMEGRVVMPVSLFAGAPKEAYTNKPALEQILAEEQKWADQANRQRTLARVENGIGAGIIAVALLTVFLLWRKYGRKHPTVFDGDYYRELPADYSPAELSVLWNFQAMNTNDLTATIMDLARRKFLSLEEATVQAKKLFGSKEVATFRINFLPPLSLPPCANRKKRCLGPTKPNLLIFSKKKSAAARIIYI
ncbi:MAG: DUF2207 domain-containing protein [Syntrophomonadaceae bacterium]|nr:DUF2207 domain-containing protein [Syntrophomonadaceae bacterium]